MPLTNSFCEHVVVNATPFPSRFQPGTAAKTTLFALGIVDDIMQGHFVHSIKNAIAPLSIDNADILSSPDTTVQAAADSVQQNAF